MKPCAALILAAGKGTRMKSGRCKVLHPIAGRPMLLYVLDAVEAAGWHKTCIVVGHQADDVRRCITKPGAELALQEPQLGTGHAVLAARGYFESFSGDVAILCGDIPLIKAETLSQLAAYHRNQGSRLTVMTTKPADPYGYGRIVRDGSGRILRIVEEKDAGPDERLIPEINTGVYMVESALLFELLEGRGTENAQHEYYLTDIIAAGVSRSIPVHGFILTDSSQVAGVNNRGELARVSAVVWSQIREKLMDEGVTLVDPSSAFIDNTVTIGADTVVHHGVTITGNTRIGGECVIEPGVYISDCTLGDRVRVLLGSRLDRAEVADDTQIGPMAHLRPEARIGKHARIGNFVEVKNSVIGDGTKASHLTYLGDSRIGTNVNIGCGTITCNYDGKHKHPTIIHDRCFVGSDVQFIAPVEIGEGSLIGAGSTITRDVPPHTLAVSRSRQKNYSLRKGQGPGSSDEDRKA